MNAKKNYIYHIIAILVVGIWGLTFISTKVLIGYGLSPQEIFLLRFLMAYLVLLSDGKYGIGNYTGYQCGFHCLHGSVAHHYSVFADL